jgi:hypothetical protein
MRGVAERNAQRISGVGGDIARRRQQTAHHECDLGFVRAPEPTTAFLIVVGAYSATCSPRRAAAASATPRA